MALRILTKQKSTRITHKIITSGGTTFTVAPSDDHYDGTWDARDLYNGEIGVNTTDQKIYMRVGNNILQLYPLSGGTDTNFANTDLTLTGDRTHTLNGKNLRILGDLDYWFELNNNGGYSKLYADDGSSTAASLLLYSGLTGNPYVGFFMDANDGTNEVSIVGRCDQKKIIFTAPSGTAVPDGNFFLGGSTAATGASHVIHLFNGTPPTGSVSGTVLVYSKDYSSNASLYFKNGDGAEFVFTNNMVGWQTDQSLILGASGNQVLILRSDQVIQGVNMHNNAATQGDSSLQEIRSGTFTPTESGDINLDSITVNDAQWMRVGNVVTMSGKFVAKETTNGTLTYFFIDLPIPSSVAEITLCGTAAAYDKNTPVSISARVNGDGGSAKICWIAAAADYTVDWSYHFTYLVT